jgi:drug/metabolite transporter (DMT)-like permease
MYRDSGKTDPTETPEGSPARAARAAGAEPLGVTGVAGVAGVDELGGAGGSAPARPIAPARPTAPARPAARPWRALAWPLFLLVATGTAWGATFSFARIAATSGAHPIGLALWQGLLGGLVLLTLALARRRPPALSRRHLGFYLVCGLLGTVVPSILYFYAASRVPAGVLSITIAMVPILTFAAALLLGIDRLAWGRAIGILCGLAAVLLIVVPEDSLPERAMALWVLLAVLAAVCYAAEGIYVAVRGPVGSDPAATVGSMLLVAALVLVPVVLLTDTFVPLGFPFGALEWSVIGMVAVNAFAYSVFYHLIQIAGPVFATQMSYVVTMAGVGWGIAIFGEQHSLWVWGALAVMLAGLALVTPRAETSAAER